MGRLRRWLGGGGRSGGSVRASSNEDVAHLEEFARSRKGVEAYVEPRTAVTETTVVMVASSGEWTRRRVDGPDGAAALARRLGIPVYDAGIVGYPARMREWNRGRTERSSEPPS